MTSREYISVNPKKPLISRSKSLSLNGGILTIIVGKEKKKFSVHEALLTSRSKFFKAAMSGNWKEAEEKVVNLPEDKPDIFELYANLVYTGLVPVLRTEENRYFKFGKNTIYCNSPRECGKEYEALCELYVLADKLGDQLAINKATDTILSKATEEFSHAKYGMCLPDATAISTIYDNTTHKCAGRQLLVELYMWYGNRESLANACEDEPEEVFQFLYDLNYANMRRRDPLDSIDIPKNLKSRYHYREGEEDMEWEYPW